MRAALLAAVLAPAAAGVLILATERAQRTLAGIGLGAGIAGAGWSLARALDVGGFGSRGLEADVWRSGLALAVLAHAVYAVVARGAEVRTSAVALGVTTSAVGTLLAADTFVAAAFLITTTAGMAALAFQAFSPHSNVLLGWLALSDLSAVIGLVLTASEGMQAPPVARGAGAAALLAGAAFRVCAPLDHAGMVGSLATGVVRAQGFLLAGWVARGGGDAATVMSVGGALVAMWYARRAAREGSAMDALCAASALVAAGLGFGTAATTAGAVLLASGVLLASLFVAARAGVEVAAPSFGAAPLGATLPGAALLASGMLARAVSDASAFATAAPALLALGWLAYAGVAGMRDGYREALPLAWIVAPLAAVAAIAFVPERALRGLAEPAAGSMDGLRTVTALTPAISDRLGITFAAAALGLVLSGAGNARPRARRSGEPVVDGAAHLSPSRVVLIIEAAGVGWLLLLLRVGIQRGFL